MRVYPNSNQHFSAITSTNCINPTSPFSFSADDTTILYKVEELPYWELNEENCLAVLAKKPVDQLGSEGSGDEEDYDAYEEDPDEAVLTGEGGEQGLNSIDIRSLRHNLGH